MKDHKSLRLIMVNDPSRGRHMGNCVIPSENILLGLQTMKDKGFVLLLLFVIGFIGFDLFNYGHGLYLI
jgi:hypothetical protein